MQMQIFVYSKTVLVQFINDILEPVVITINTIN